MTSLKSIRLKDFRNHASTCIDLEQINIFVGPSGAGKSSIKEAIEFALTGVCSFTDERGAGADCLVRDGAKAAAANVVIDGLGMVTRAIPHGLQVTGQDGQPWTGTLMAQQGALEHALGVDAKVIRACLNTTRFLAMKPDEQKDLLFRLVGLSFDQEKIEDALTQWCTEQHQPAFDPVVSLRQTYPPGLAGGPEVLDRIHKAVYDERTAAKRNLKNLEARVSTPLPASSLPPGATREAIAAQLTEIRKEKESLLVQQGETTGQARARETLDRELTRLHQELAALEETKVQYDLAKAADLEKTFRETNVKIRDQQEIARTRRGLAVSSDKQAAELRGKIKAFSEGGICPVAATPCAAKAAVIPALEEQVRQLDAVRDKDLAAAQKAEADAKAAKAKAVEIEAQFQGAERARRAGSIKQSMEGIESQLASLPMPADTSSLSEQIAALATRITAGEQMLRTADAEDRAKDDRKKLDAEYAAAKDHVEALELLVEAFGPKGIKGRLLQNLLGPVEEGAKRRLAQLTGGRWDIAFRLDEGFEVLAKTHPGGAFRSVKTLSKGERLRVGVILQLALNELTGFGILVVDDAEALGPRDRVLLTQTLLAFREEFGTAIVLAVLGDVQPQDPGIPGVAVFEVADGTVSQITSEVGKSA